MAYSNLHFSCGINWEEMMFVIKYDILISFLREMIKYKSLYV